VLAFVFAVAGLHVWVVVGFFGGTGGGVWRGSGGRRGLGVSRGIACGSTYTFISFWVFLINRVDL
jgi:hypothetical protein